MAGATPIADEQPYLENDPDPTIPRHFWHELDRSWHFSMPSQPYALIPPGHPLFGKWEHDQRACLLRIAEACPYKEQDILAELKLAAKAREDGSHAAVLCIGIGTKDIEADRWRQMQPAVLRFLAEYYPEHGVLFRFVKSNAVSLRDLKPGPSEWDLLYSIWRPYYEHLQEAHLGCSIAAKGVDRIGSIGAFVRVKDPSGGGLRPGQYAITCGHIVPSPPAHPGRRGKSKPITMVVPAEADTKKTAHWHKQYADHYKSIADLNRLKCGATLDLTEEECLVMGEFGRNLVAARRCLARFQEKFNYEDGLRERIEKFDADFGEVVGTSGRDSYRMLKPKGKEAYAVPMDWALIKLYQTRSGINQIPPPPKAHWPTEMPECWHPVFSNCNIHSTANHHSQDRVMKHGRSSGVNSGTIDGKRGLRIAPATITDLTGCRFLGEPSIVAHQPSTTNSYRKFANRGDSGSSVLNTKFESLGMVRGVESGCGAGADVDRTFFTPWSFIFKDIKETLGLEVVWDPPAPSSSKA